MGSGGTVACPAVILRRASDVGIDVHPRLLKLPRKKAILSLASLAQDDDRGRFARSGGRPGPLRSLRMTTVAAALA